jgi:HEAT repeat protein
MNPLKPILLGTALACVLLAQDPQPQPAPRAPKPPVQPAAPEPPRPPKIHTERLRERSFDKNYEQGTRALDAGRWDDARQIFDAVAAAKGPRADGALYWRAYAENRLGRRNEALATLSLLRQQYPSSEWLNDAQALSVEVQQQAGKPVDPDAEANEELKLMAINALIGTDPERAMPLLEKILKSASSPRLKDRALFVLTQNRSPQAQQLLSGIAKGGGNPDLQLRALNYMAMSGNKTAIPEIVAIYNASHNVAMKRQAINSLMVAKAADELYNIARTEQDPALRAEAIQGLGVLRQPDKLWQLYQAGIAKETILENMFMLGDPDRLTEIARTEKDPKLRGAAIQSLGAMRSSKAGETLVSLYASEQDPVFKKKIVEALFVQRNAKALIDIARKESNTGMKRDIVEKLSLMHSKEATDFMMELLK